MSATAFAASGALAAGVVPGLPADLVKSLGCPLDDVEGVCALHCLRAALGDDLGDPVGLVGRHMRDQGAALGAERVKEPS